MNLPNRLTVGRLFLCGFFILALELDIRGSGFIALAVFVLASLTDWLDGYLARKLNLITDLGKLLDPLADKILVAAAYIGLSSHGWAPAWIVSCIIAREFLITGLRTLAASKGVILAAEKMGKHKTISQIVTVIIGLALLSLAEWGVDPTPIDAARVWIYVPMLYLTLAITIYSGVRYFLINRKLVFEVQR